MGACVKTRERAKLYALADQYAKQISGAKHACTRSREWSILALEIRMAVMMLAGIDGDLSALARRAWQEFTPPERTAVQVAMRGLHRGLGQTMALRGRAV